MATYNGTQNPDSFSGTDGNDVMFGGNSSDKLFGGRGYDTIFGGDGEDSVRGGIGDDSIDGGQGQDRIAGNEGDDRVDGGGGDDTIEGEAGADTISGGQGQDRIYGGEGNDDLYDGDGPSGNVDSLYGGAGDDILRVSGNGDRAYGGEGSDTFIVKATGNFNEIRVYGGEDGCGPEEDVLDLGALYEQDPNLVLHYERGGPGSESGQILVKGSGGREYGRIFFEGIESIICFAAGTRIATPHGDAAVEELRAGDLVLTRDHGPRRLRWVGRRDLGPGEMEPQFQPVIIRPGALGRGMPHHDLTVSPQHRLLIGGAAVELHFGEHEVLVAARHLVGRPGIERLLLDRVSYVHLLFDHHEIVLSNGAWTESFHPGDWSLHGLGTAQREEVLALFPELSKPDGRAAYRSARLTVRSREASVLLP